MNIGLIAYNARKKLTQNFCVAYRGILAKHMSFVTRTMRCLAEEVTNLTVHKYLARHLDGEQQFGAQIEDNGPGLVIFLRDPLQPKPYESNVNNIFRLYDVHDTPAATDLVTVGLLIKLVECGDFKFQSYCRR